MAKKISELRAELTLDSAKMRAGALAAKKSMKRFTDDVKVGLNQLKTVAAGVFAGITAAVGKMSANILTEGDRFDKLNAQLGLPVETLSRLSFAAGRTGTDLEKMAKATRKMQESIFDANAGLSTQVRAFEALGINIEELRKLSPEEQFLTIADAMGNVANQGDRTAVAFDIFGRGAEAVLQASKNGAAGIRELFNESDRLGKTMRGEQATAIANFNDLMGDLKTIAEATVRDSLLPFLQAVTDNRAALENWVKNGAEQTIVALVNLGRSVKFIITGFQVLEAGIASIGIAFGKLFQKANEFFAFFSDEYAAKARAWEEETDRAARNVENILDEINNTWKDQPLWVNSAREAIQGFGQVAAQSLNQAAQGAQNLTNNIRQARAEILQSGAVAQLGGPSPITPSAINPGGSSLAGNAGPSLAGAGGGGSSVRIDNFNVIGGEQSPMEIGQEVTRTFQRTFGRVILPDRVGHDLFGQLRIRRF